QAAERARHTVDVGELRKRQHSLQPERWIGTVRDDLKDCLGYCWPVSGLEASVSQPLEDVDSYLSRLAPIRQDVHQERHDARIVELLQVQQSGELGRHRPSRP